MSGPNQTLQPTAGASFFFIYDRRIYRRACKARQSTKRAGSRCTPFAFGQPLDLATSQNRALESFLVAVRRMIWPQSLGKAQMKTILMLIVGLMLAGCGSMENHVRNHGVASTSGPASQDRGNRIAVDTICACP
jgi:hypothetical protein